MHDRLGGRTMLRDPARGRIIANERVEQLLQLRFLMNTHTTEIQRECQFMIILIGLDGVQEV